MKIRVLMCVLMSLLLLPVCAGCGSSNNVNGTAQTKEVPVQGTEARPGSDIRSGTETAFPVTASYEIPERDPFMPLVAREPGTAEGSSSSPHEAMAGSGAFQPWNPGGSLQPLSPPGGNATSPAAGNVSGGSYTRFGPEMELISCYRDGDIDHAYIGFQGNVYDVVVGQSLDGYMVTAIDPVKVNVSLVKDGETYILTGKAPVK